MDSLSSNTDPFPPAEFDQWAEQYDNDVTRTGFPFTGYDRVMAEVVRLADAQPGMSVLDIGTGTGNLLKQFAACGCDLWGTDFSTEMLALARAKLPDVILFLHDLRQPFPPELERRFDRIVSAYVFHHLELPQKAATAQRLVQDHLLPGGQLIVADVSFPSRAALDAVRQQVGDGWDEEPYWIADEALPALEAAGLTADYIQVSDCAGVYRITARG